METLYNDGSASTQQLDTHLLLRAYGAGLFPMADSRDAQDIFWVEPKIRGIIPLSQFHLSSSLAKFLKQERLFHTQNLAFPQVVQHCASPAKGREDSWINNSIYRAYLELHRQGHAHSVETWDAQGRLVGGLYGVCMGGAFFGESMFSRATNASKSALAHLVARLRCGSFKLLDTQFLTQHLSQFGAREVPRAKYLKMLELAIPSPADWTRLDAEQPYSLTATVSLSEVSVDLGASDFRAAEVRVAPEVLAGLGPSGKRIAQLLSQTS